VVCHGDPHAGNVLRRGDGWALIDPDGFVGERAYDLGVVMRDACREITDAEASQPGAARPMRARNDATWPSPLTSIQSASGNGDS
jgi:streptomycin 6-kinase